jgi:hypothetical protein
VKKSKPTPLLNQLRKRAKRNGSLFDVWSVVHLGTGIVLGWVLDPFVALAILVLWEPLEIFVLSPLLAKKGIVFGYESLRNSLSDIVFDVIGVALGAWLVVKLLDPPF